MFCWLHSTNCRPLAIRFKEHYIAFKTNSGQSKFTKNNILQHHLFIPMESIINIVSKISKRKALLTPHLTFWTFHDDFTPSDCSPKSKSIFMVCASKLMKTSKRTLQHQGLDYVISCYSNCLSRMVTASKNRLHMCLDLTHVLLTANGSHYK
jgi:hypothetical protein